MDLQTLKCQPLNLSLLDLHVHSFAFHFFPGVDEPVLCSPLRKQDCFCPPRSHPVVDGPPGALGEVSELKLPERHPPRLLRSTLLCAWMEPSAGNLALLLRFAAVVHFTSLSLLCDQSHPLEVRASGQASFLMQDIIKVRSS